MISVVSNSDVERVGYAEMHENEEQNVAPNVDDLKIIIFFAASLCAHIGQLLFERIGEFGFGEQFIVLLLQSAVSSDDFFGEFIRGRHDGQTDECWTMSGDSGEMGFERFREV